VIAAAQLMVVLDVTIVNIALPHIQNALHFSTTDLTWVINAYTLTFGGLLLLGGRVGDILGRRRVFITGVLLFALASALGGFAVNSGWLLAARALQGIGGAIASPTALALIATNFKEGPPRNRAFGVLSAVSGAGGAIGLLAGGMLTSWLSWRWVLFVNVPIGIAIAVLAPLYINESPRNRGRFDIAGALTSTIGMVSLVYGFIRAAQHGWSDTQTLTAFAVSVVLLAAFVVVERRSPQPITPLKLFRSRDRTSTYAVMLLVAAAMFSIFFFLTLFVQDILGYSPLRAGVAFLPISAAIVVSAQISSRMQARFGPKLSLLAGTLLITAGLLWLTQVTASTGYVEGVLGPTLVFGLGMGQIFVPVMLVAVTGVPARETGAASGMLNATQQVGGSLGLSILTTVFATSTRNSGKQQSAEFLKHATPQQLAQFQHTHQLPPPYASHVLAHGISTAYQMGAIFGAVSLLIAIFGIRARSAATLGQETGHEAPAPEDASAASGPEPAPAGDR